MVKHTVKRPKKAEVKEMEAGLRAIYGEEVGDLKKVTPGSSVATYWLLRFIALLFGGSVVTILVLFIFSSGLFLPKEPTLDLQIIAPPSVKSGEVVDLEILYINQGKLPLASLEIDVNLPKGFVVNDLLPAPSNEEELIFNVGSLGGRSDGKIVISGLWLSDAMSTKSIQAIANYRPSNFNAIFSDIATQSVLTSESVLELSLSGPKTALPGEIVTYEAVVANTGLLPIENSEIVFALPENFILTNSSPVLPPGDSPVFKLEPINSQGRAVITLTGSFSSEAHDLENILATVQLSAAQAAPIMQASSSLATDVKGGDLRLSLVANGLTGQVFTAPGADLSLGFRLENTGQVEISDPQVLLDFQPVKGIPIVWSGAKLDSGVLTKDGILFSPQTIKKLLPGEKKTFNLSFPVKAVFAQDDLDAFTVVARASAGGNSLLSTPLQVLVNAGVELSAEARYFNSDGVPVGSGPLPPSVNRETSYEIAWRISRSLHALEDIKISAALPSGVSFAGSAVPVMGEVLFDDLTRTVSFVSSSLPDDYSDVTIRFMVTAIPGADDLNTFMKLLSSSSLVATDLKTGARREAVANDLTTELIGDNYAAGKGTVITGN